MNATADPDSQALYKIRNKLEHSYLKLHDIGSGKKPVDLFHDRMAYSLEYGEFERRTLRVLKLARAALIYLALGVDREERRSHPPEDDAGTGAIPMQLDGFDDAWKR